MQQEVMFTACPQARVPTGLVVSVVISPRLDPQGDPQRLDTFPDFLDWPAQNIRWQVSVGNEAPLDATVVTDPLPDSTRWTALFSDDTLVRGPEFPKYTQYLWHSYPVGHVVDFIHNLYQQFATNHPTEHPPVLDLDASGLGLLAQMDEIGRDRRPTLRRLYIEQLKLSLALPPGPADPESDFFQLWNFHQPGSLMAAALTPPTFDFHEVVALCDEHFGLMRRLGLVVDLLVPMSSIPIGDTTVQIRPDWTPQITNSTNILPITHCTIGPTQFLPTPKDPQEIIDGRLPLDDVGRYRVVLPDPDGSALKLMMLARNRIYAKLFPSEDTPQAEPLPALKSGGISIARTGKADQLKKHVAASAQLHTLRTQGQPMHLFAEDLWYGTRFDVWDAATERWHSLQQRQTDYTFLSLPAPDQNVVIAEEGAMVEAPTERDEQGENPDGDSFFLQESLMRWDGWSLAAPRPGRTLNEQDQVIDEPDDTADGYPLRIRSRATAGTLPKLRFGRRYQIRARTVDPAGNSVPFDDSAAHAVTVAYQRYEPVPTPFVLLTAPRTEGESDAQPVLRSNYATPPDPAAVERILTPPRAAQLTAEQHGMWDGNWDNPAAVYAQIVAREDKGFHEAGFGVPDANNYDQPYFPQKPVPITYLPDPMAQGVALRFYPESGGDPVHLQIPFSTGDPWPDARPIRLIVEEGAGKPVIQETDGEVEVRYMLPKAETAKVRVSSYVRMADLSQSAIWQLMAESGAPAAQLDAWRALAEAGRLWMITPYRTLTLVHAVRQPLKPPAFQSLNYSRLAGNTFAGIGGLLEFSRKSTARVDLHASWQEPVDLGPGGGVAAAPPQYGDTMRAHEEWLDLPLVEFQSGMEDFLAMNRRHEFHDTKRRIVTYTAKATSKFTEYYQTRIKNVPVTTDEVVTLDGAPLVEGTELVRAPTDGPSFERGTDYEMDYQSGDLTWKGANTQVDIVYLPEPITRLSAEAADPAHRAKTLDIPSAARPLAPKVLYAIPTHRWQTTPISSTGKGGGLRIYLDRPFFETGEGQLLGVVLDPSPNAPSAALAAYTTRWGFDPIQGPPALPTRAPRPQDFPLAVPGATGMDRVLAENGMAVDAVGHDVGYDSQRNLWYSDIEVDAGLAHMPFIRLALASYQPHSVANLHLSAVVMADIVQLTPDRTVTLQLGVAVPGEPPPSVKITILGTAPIPGSPPTGPTGILTEITAHVEYRRGDIADELLGWAQVANAQARGVLQATPGDDGMTIWQGQLQLPPSVRQAQIGNPGAFRVVIEEWQLLQGSEDRKLYLPRVQQKAAPGDEESEPARPGEVPSPTRRLVYRDYIPLES